MTLKQGTDMATPLVHIVDYFDISCSSESPQDPSCSPVLPSWTTFWLPQDPATKGGSTSHSGSLEDSVACV